MFKLRKKAKDDNSNPFTGYVADGLAVADFNAEDSDGETAVQNEPAPEIEALNLSVQEQPTPLEEDPELTPEPAPKPTAAAAPTPPPKPVAPIQPPMKQPLSQPTTQPVKPPESVRVTPATPTTAEVDVAIKEAEAATELPAEELLDDGVAPAISEGSEVVTDQVEEVVQAAPAPAPTPTVTVTPEVAEPVAQTVPVLSADEERAAAVATHKELADLLGWVERDTNQKMVEIQAIINDLNSKIDHLRTSFAQDTARLSETARIAFKENIEKNITLIKDQANREAAKKDVLQSQKEEFVDKIHEALKKYKAGSKRTD